ncbi:sodium- and chloride-dependent glycine transporter 2-like [Anneissia japonica]|uniref:sodium- and chloride-dependent glycine transporter 2-like n=1 Tax=Anneissia japonica TaxID=1529436 RepID=UPI0014254FE9|nr:sodium- and chloride-dependent glycine transporter 2-like [Anneissia japonica]
MSKSDAEAPAIPLCEQSVEKPPVTNVDDEEESDRGNWGAHLEFLLSCLGYAVGLGNVWRFPYLCYSNGGGMQCAFCVGYGMVMVSFLVCIYYNVIITYTIYYLFSSFTKKLPWIGCDNDWNTDFCSELYTDCISSGGIIMDDGKCIATTNLTTAEKSYYNLTAEGNVTDAYVDPLKADRKLPSFEFYRYEMLQMTEDIGDLGGVRWQLALCLLLAWFIVFCCLAKGVKSSGKVMYFTATFPYLVLFILLIRGLTLEGHREGIEFFIKPKFHLLKNPKVWKDAAVQIFYSLSASWGGLITLSSFNKFNNNCLRDAMIVPILNCLTSVFAGFVIFSILGFLAHKLGKPVEEVVDEQFGLAFIAYPAAVANLPVSPLWSVLFFMMLLTLGLGSEIVIVQTVMTAVIDEFPSYLKKKKVWVIGVISIIGYLIGLLLVTRGGNFWVILMDKYAADFALLIYGLCECIGLGWLYGAKRFINDIRSMIGNRLVDTRLFMWWPINWCALTPAVLSFVLLFNWISWEPPTAGDTEFPPWAHVIGWLMIISTLFWIPLFIGIEFYKTRGTGDSLINRLNTMKTSRPEWGPALKRNRRHAIEVHRAYGTEMGGTAEIKTPVCNGYSPVTCIPASTEKQANV